MTIAALFRRKRGHLTALALHFRGAFGREGKQARKQRDPIQLSTLCITRADTVRDLVTGELADDAETGS
jgi:hypothetical protein